MNFACTCNVSLMGYFIFGEYFNLTQTKGMPGPGFVLPVGFVPGQAFGLTDCRKLRLTDASGSRLIRLVRLRNLWPSVRVEWTGPWSEGSTEWLSLPSHDRTKVGLVKSNEEFW